MLKESFKYYKQKCPPPCLNEVIEFSRRDIADSRITNVNPCDIASWDDIGLKPIREWEIFNLKDKPGFIFISNPFKPIGQRYWIYRCLKSYTRKPNRLNLDAHGDVEYHEDWWEKCHMNHEIGSLLLKKLRWTTLGYHHNWDTKVYSECARDDFPEDLGLLSHHVAGTVGFAKFSPEAAIVNYYHMDSTLSCHTDHSELNLEAPLLSFSFGQSAVFLLGGKTKEEKPIAIMIHSGDIVIMSGESRLCYHGVPSIIPAKSRPWDINDVERSKLEVEKKFDISSDSIKYGPCNLISSVFTECFCDESWKPFENYISTSRINMNVRQVLPFGCVSL